MSVSSHDASFGGEESFVAKSETVADSLVGERLDRVVALAWGCSRAEATRLIGGDGVAVNGVLANSRSQRLAAGDRIDLLVEPVLGPPKLEADPAVELSLIYEDDHVVVMDKAAGMVVHPGSGHHQGTVVHGLLARFPDIADVGDQDRPGIVHRLDRGTSGLMMVARTQQSYQKLVEALSSREVHRGYHALVSGIPADDRGIIDAPVARSIRHPTKMAVTAGGRPARTHYRVIARMSASEWRQESAEGQELSEPTDAFVLGDVAGMDLKLETGRTHQIRVHLAAIGHPVLGDSLYGGPEVLGINRPALHAHALAFAHPVTGEQMEFSAQPPDDFANLWGLLGQ